MKDLAPNLVSHIKMGKETLTFGDIKIEKK